MAFTAAALCLCLSRARGAGLPVFLHYWGDVVVATDTTREGRALTPPTPDKPVYYLGESLGCKLGSMPGDDLPDVKKMNRFVAKVLAKQGYLYAPPGKHEPTLFLVLQWGYLDPRNSNDLLWFLGYNPDKDIAAPTAIGRLGAEVFRRDFRSREIETVLDDANESIYGIIVTAFEFKSASTATPIAYWQTRIALPTVGKSMARALPAMVLAAGPAIGKPADSPVLRNADKVRSSSVEFGELKVLGVVDEQARPDKGANAKR